MFRILIVCVFLIHSYFTCYSWFEFGYLGFFPPFKDSNTLQIFSDLVIAALIVNIWIFLDLKKHQKPLYFSGLVMLGTILSGSFAFLLYFLIRGEKWKSEVKKVF